MHLDGKELEACVVYRCHEIDEKAGRYTLCRYGTTAVMIEQLWTPVKSLPDFEGALAGGRQFIIECKTCSQASYALSGGTSKSFVNQHKHLRKRSRFGVLTAMLIHFNERVLKTKVDPEFTVLLPVNDNMVIWQQYDKGVQRHISRVEARTYGIEVVWDIPKGRQKLSPNLYNAILELQTRIDKRTTHDDNTSNVTVSTTPERS